VTQAAHTPRRFATQLRIAIAIIVAAALLLAFGGFWLGWQRFVVQQRGTELADRLSALAVAEADEPQVAGGADPVRDRLLRVESRLLGASVFITDDRGVVVRSSEDSAAPSSVDLALLGTPDAEGVRRAVLTGATDARLLVVAVPVGDGRQVVGVQRLSQVRAAQDTLLQIGTLALLGAFLVAWLLGGWIARRLTAPVVRLDEAAQRVAAGEWGTQVAEQGSAETVSLARSFNRMSKRVADTYAAQEAFVADVSHEIRTPLTSIRGFATALGDGTVDGDEQRARAAGVIVTETERIAELTTSLLELAQLDAGAVALDDSPVDTALLADALEGRFAAPAAARGVDVVVAMGPGAPRADADRLLEAVSTLVANALAFVPDGGRVEVRSELDGGVWRLTVDDSGPGIPAADRERVFDRFAKADSSRSRAEGGSGLGLSICRRVVEAMGGRVWAQESPLGGARLVIELPVA